MKSHTSIWDRPFTLRIILWWIFMIAGFPLVVLFTVWWVIEGVREDITHARQMARDVRQGPTPAVVFWDRVELRLGPCGPLSRRLIGWWVGLPRG